MDNGVSIPFQLLKSPQKSISYVLQRMTIGDLFVQKWK
ncbi:uncharacterized protein CELE_Y17G9B.2 [Caenorhabditis elegans]|uniref:Uncharacterized protein n=1 Tax=Caenorhabditis elegans TaxID=6239 RepID=Q9N573_CAEEL|nr:Uncharacterized protein CELE_Y17G9B.2 [Caenorhabditis elegans]CCD68713.1 Uncharacterized protein CELE_Y17G9B.2 [Caenorhabditis elegans]|eukprot:NP_500638.1 Uncharacterized protein CELE_Y17G9B.2 [Caenorhabditis elegans]